MEADTEDAGGGGAEEEGAADENVLPYPRLNPNLHPYGISSFLIFHFV